MRKLDIPANINRERRIVLDGRIPKKKNWPRVFDVLPSASLVRTFLSSGGPLPFKFRLLKVLTSVKFASLNDISQNVNLRYLNWSLKHGNLNYKLPSSISLLWNVHTLSFREFYDRMDTPLEIWYMRQLRHLQFFEIFLPNPPPNVKVEQQDDVLLPNLQTLSTVVNFSFTELVCKRIPNIKKLRITYTGIFEAEFQRKCYYYLDQLHKLQSLCCSFGVAKRGEFLQNLVFPSSLRKLSLSCCGLHWEDLNKFGLSLPHLQVLKLYMHAVVGSKWDCVEGAFPRLKFLHIKNVDLIKWTAESSDFFPMLEKIPSGIGEIHMLRYLQVYFCSASAAISSTEILEEQLSLENEDIQVEVNLSRANVKSFMKKVDIKSIPSKNLEFDIV